MRFGEFMCFDVVLFIFVFVGSRWHPFMRFGVQTNMFGPLVPNKSFESALAVAAGAFCQHKKAFLDFWVSQKHFLCVCLFFRFQWVSWVP